MRPVARTWLRIAPHRGRVVALLVISLAGLTSISFLIDQLKRTHAQSPGATESRFSEGLAETPPETTTSICKATSNASGTPNPIADDLTAETDQAGLVTLARVDENPGRDPETRIDPNAGAEPEARSFRNVRVRERDGRSHVARIYGGIDSGVVLLPDGRLGWPEGLAFTDEPFIPSTADTLERELRAGEYLDFDTLRTENYLIFYRCRPAFARSSGNLLESLYQGLLESVAQKGLPVEEAEFPLIAVIDPDEASFRVSHDIPGDVEAFYNVVTNRIHFYESSERDRLAPDLAARRKPQTVAHEGAHQVLHNIGVQPRLASWPIWLVEGLAEYFAPTTLKKGDHWDGANHVNPFHMATLRELQDPLANILHQKGLSGPRVDRQPGMPLIEHLVTRTELSPTDYAISWALAHYLFNAEDRAFRVYLKMLSERQPLLEYGPEDHLADFRHIFGQDLAGMDRSVARYLARLKDAERLLFYAVIFEQPIGPGVVRRAALVSQSPAMIRQWVEENSSSLGGPIFWRAQPFPTRSRALIATENWLQHGR